MMAATMFVAAVGSAGIVGKPLEAKAAGKVVVVDPGHGGYDSGAAGHGLKEKDLTLKIANYLATGLRRRGFSVYMTRTSDKYVSLDERTAYAANVGAQAFVSVHLNANVSAAAHGAEVWFPNSNYDKNANNVGRKMASSIVSALSSLGISNRGISSRNYAPPSAHSTVRYPDGSIADYYAVIRTAKEHHIPGIIIESAFITNASDVSRFLSTDSKLQAIGEAEAGAIASALGGSSGGNTSGGGTGSGSGSGTQIEVPPVSKTVFTSVKATGTDNEVKLKWKKSTNADGYYVYRKSEKDSMWTHIADTTETSFTDKGCSYGQTYLYDVVGYNNQGGRTVLGNGGVKVTIPEKVIDIESVNDGGLRRETVTWKQDEKADGYYLYRSYDGEEYTQVAEIEGSDTTEYTDSDVEKNSIVYYYVRAYRQAPAYQYKDNGKPTTHHDTVLTSVPEEPVSTETDSDAPEPITAVAASTGGSITVSWKKYPDSGVHYRLYRSEEGGSFTRIADTEDLSYTDTDVTAGITYTYRMRVRRDSVTEPKKNIWSSYSRKVKVTVPDNVYQEITVSQ